ARDWPAEDVIPLIKLVAERANKIENGRCYFTEQQARAILDMRLSKLTGLEREKIDNDLEALAAEITDYLETLDSRTKLMGILTDELIEIKEEFATPRRTTFEENEFEHDIEDLIAKEDMVVTVTMAGYIKRVPLSTYRAQKRGGKGRSGLNMKDEDVTSKVYISNTHTPMLFFSNHGKVYKTKVYRLPLGGPQSRGRALVNIFPLTEGEIITNIMSMPEDEDSWDNLNIMFATAKGNIRRSDMMDFKRVQSNGKIAIRLEEGDALVGVLPCTDDEHILLASAEGKSIRFPVSSLRVIKSRTSNGVKGMTLAADDKVISFTILNGREADIETRDAYLKISVDARARISSFLAIEEDNTQGVQSESEEEIAQLINEVSEQVSLPAELIRELAYDEEFILTITENGYGKRSSSYEYRVTNRGGKGVVNIITSERNGKVVKSFPANDDNQIMLITDAGKLIRCPVKDIRIAGRNTQGVTIFRTAQNEKVVSASLIAEPAQDDKIETEEDS
ncbi:MAG: DNA gyrase subunit A, partial [Rickettsiales bacterium]|nr:DNA gyrase subunit A [Rickettsiales bacterium]